MPAFAPVAVFIGCFLLDTAAIVLVIGGAEFPGAQCVLKVVLVTMGVSVLNWNWTLLLLVSRTVIIPLVSPTATVGPFIEIDVTGLSILIARVSVTSLFRSVNLTSLSSPNSAF